MTNEQITAIEEIKKAADRLNSIIEKMSENVENKCCSACSC